MDKRLFLVLIFTALLVFQAYCDDTWHIETVLTEGDVGNYASLKLDSNNNPHIAHYEYNGKKLLYSSYDGSNWQTCFAEPDASSGSHCSLALDANDLPHIAYYDSSNYDLKYAYYDGTQWIIQVVDEDGQVGLYTSIALDSNQLPHISYWDMTNDDLKYASFNGIDWIVETVDSDGEVGQETSLALDSQDLPHISYMDRTTLVGNLKYAHFDGSNWNMELIDEEGDCAHDTSIAIDSIGRVHIAHVDWDHTPRYVFYNGSYWEIEVIGSGDMGGWYTSLVLDEDDTAHVSLCSVPSPSNLVYAHRVGLDWFTETVDSSYLSGFYSSIALDSMERPVIAYQNANMSFDLKLAWFGEGYLGVRLLSFTSHPSNQGIALEWSTEVNAGSELTGYNIYRALYSAKARIKEIKLNSALINPERKCTFIDRESLPDANYTYRLEAILSTGKAASLGTLCTQWQQKRTFNIGNIYPQPSKNYINFTLLTSDSQTPVKASIYDITGRLISTRCFPCNPGVTQINQVDTSGLSAGVYFLRINQGNDQSCKRVVVSH